MKTTDIISANSFAGSRPRRVLMSGGGTGGHIFPAVAIAQDIQKRYPDTEFLFIGAAGKMEMEKVPQAGFRVEGLNIAGFDRGNLLANFRLPFKIVSSLVKARQIIKHFQPDFAVGTGGFASGPALFIAAKLGIPTFIQEQNSLPGKTNVFNAKSAKAVFTAYPDMEKFFQGTETFFYGNPVRENITAPFLTQQEAKEKLGLSSDKLTILSVGGSLGSRTLNNAWKHNFKNLEKSGWELIWQTGKTDWNSLKADAEIAVIGPQIQLKEFIADMPLHYAAADVIVSRAGAIAISELAIAGKPVILVPLPTAAEDHQTRNALNLVEKNAARMVKDAEMKEKFWPTLSELCGNKALRTEMGENIKYFAKPEATRAIVDEIFSILGYHDETTFK